MNRIPAHILFAVVTIMGASSFAQIQCDLNCQHQQGLTITEQLLSESTKSLPQDENCPSPGQVLLPLLARSQGPITASAIALPKLITNIDPTIQQTANDQSKCGACVQKNTLTKISSSGPMKTIFKNECTNRPQKTIHQVFQKESEIQSFIETTLKGQTPDGQALYQGCPDPCTFHITSASSPLEDGKTQLSLTVQCGHPRAGFIMAVPYEYQVSLIQQWSCNAPAPAVGPTATTTQSLNVLESSISRALMSAFKELLSMAD